MSNGARQFPETGDFAPFCANRFCADGLFYFHVELFRCAGGIASAEATKGHENKRSLRSPFGNLRRAPMFLGFYCGLKMRLHASGVLS